MVRKAAPLTTGERDAALEALRRGDFECEAVGRVTQYAVLTRRKPNRARKMVQILHRLATRKRVSSVTLSRITLGWERSLRALRELGFCVEFTPMPGKDYGWYALKDGTVWTADVLVTINGRQEVVPVEVMANSRTHALKAAHFKAVRCAVLPESVRMAS